MILTVEALAGEQGALGREEAAPTPDPAWRYNRVPLLILASLAAVLAVFGIASVGWHLANEFAVSHESSEAPIRIAAVPPSVQRSLGLRPRIVACESGRKMVADNIGRPPQRVRVEMGVARRRCGLRVAEKLADDGKSKARARANRREGVPKIMDAHPFEPRVPLNSSPRLLKVGARPIRVGAGDDKDAAAFAVP